MNIADALDLIPLDYAARGRRSLSDATIRIAHLRRHLDCTKELATLRGPTLLAYHGRRQAEGASNASVNREIAMLRRACTLAEEPWPAKSWQKLPEPKPRDGFSSPEELTRICAQLPPMLQDAVRFYFLTGCRRDELFRLRWAHVDQEARVLLFTETKNGEDRRFPYGPYPALREIIERRDRQRQGEHVFHRNGKRILSMYAAWRTACTRAGCPGRLIHDFRRTFVMNAFEATKDRKLCMQLVGHKTESMFQRYYIVRDRAVEDGVAAIGQVVKL